MNLSDLNFSFPDELIATEPATESRIMSVIDSTPNPTEITKQELLEQIKPNDVLVINNSKVLKRRVFTEEGLEILFLQPKNQEKTQWEVLMPARKVKNKEFKLPMNKTARIVQRTLPQIIEASQPLTDEYFETNAELPLPPYIQKMRSERKPIIKDKDWYQTDWAKSPGSLAAPTASFHFTQDDLKALKDKSVLVEEITLHVGLGTFLPINVEDLNQHEMHAEYVTVTKQTWENLQNKKGHVWALGTTVTRSLESVAQGLLEKDAEGNYSGYTKLFIQPGFTYQVVDRLLTNFHQPKTTLLALVMAFAGESRVKECYQWAIDKQFRLFSYGDLSVWSKKQ